jgi:NADH dehydrogenase
VVNAVSLYVEQRPNTSWSVHVEAASRLARCSRAMGVTRFVHVSGIGAKETSSSSYIRSRGEGEQAVRAAFPQAVIVRPSVMFGPDDAFLTPLANLVQKAPRIPALRRGGDGAAAVLCGRRRRGGCAHSGGALPRTNI